MGSSYDLYADSTLVGTFLLLGVSFLANDDTGPLAAAMSPDVIYE